MSENWKLVRFAADDAEEIVARIAEANPRAAEEVAARLVEDFRLLAQWPHLGRKREDLAGEDVRYYVSGNYLIFYQASTRPLEVIAIVHGARDVAAILEKREL